MGTPQRAQLVRDLLGGRVVRMQKTTADSVEGYSRVRESVSSTSRGLERLEEAGRGADRGEPSPSEGADSGAANPSPSVLRRPKFKSSGHLTGLTFEVDVDASPGDRMKPSRQRALFDDDELIGTTG